MLINLFLMVVILINTQQDIIPIHFDYMGNVDGWGSKWIYLLFAVIPFCVMAGAEIYWHKNSAASDEIEKKSFYQQLIPIFCWLFILLDWVFLIIALNPRTNDVRQKALLMISTGIAAIVLSNYMGKVRRNAWYGIRVPWTLMDDVVWDKTHRLGGYLGVVSGLLLVVGGILEVIFHFKWVFKVTMPIAAILFIVVPIGYSIFLYYWRRQTEA